MRGKAQGLTAASATSLGAMIRSRAAVRSRLSLGLDTEGVSPRKQVGDAESVLGMIGRGNSKDYEDEL